MLRWGCTRPYRSLETFSTCRPVSGTAFQAYGFNKGKKWIVYVCDVDNNWINLEVVLINCTTMQMIGVSKVFPLGNNKLSDDSIHWHYDNGSRISNYAYDLDKKKCYAIQGKGEVPSGRVRSCFSIGQYFYIVTETFYDSGKIYHFNHIDLKWKSIQTRGYNKLQNLTEGLVKNQKAYFLFGFPEKQFLYYLDLNSFEWMLITSVPSRMGQLASCDGSNFIYINSVLDSDLGSITRFDVSTNRMQRVPVQEKGNYPGVYGCNMSIGKRIIYPSSLSIANSCARKLSFSLNYKVLNTDTTLKDLAMDVVVKNKLNTKLLPKSIQEDIDRLYKCEFSLSTGPE